MRANRLRYFLFLLASLIFAYFYGGRVPYTLLYVIMILPVISLLHVYLVYLRFKVVQELDRNLVRKGDTVDYRFSLANEDFMLYPYIRVIFYDGKVVFGGWKGEEWFSLPPRKGIQYHHQLYCKYRGVFQTGIQLVEMTDFLGLLKLSYRPSEPMRITVYPKIIHLQKFKMKRNDIAEAEWTLHDTREDASSLTGTRKYQWGDSPRRVHWKLSAKMNELMVKKYQSTSEYSATVFLDVRKADSPCEESIALEDKLIEGTVAILHYCLTNRIPVDLVTCNEGLVVREVLELKDFNRIYEHLSTIAFLGETDIGDVLDIHLRDQGARNDIIILTARLGPKLYEQLYKVRLWGYEVSLVHIREEAPTSDVMVPTGYMKGQPSDFYGRGSSNPPMDDGLEGFYEMDALSYLTEMGVNPYSIGIHDDIKFHLEK